MRYLVALVMLVSGTLLTEFAAGETGSAEIYASRVLPLLRSPAGSSCQECHFSGIELSDFLTEDESETFARLRSDGWIDPAHPKQSKLLTFVHRHAGNTTDSMAELRRKESEAIAQWIQAAAANVSLMQAKPASKIGIELDLELVRHLRKDQVLSRFLDNIWSEMGRCVNCHSPDRNQRQVKEHGEQMSWIVPHDPGATLAYLVDNELIDLDDPDKSEIRTKPTVMVDHGGGPKFPVGSASDKRFLEFLRDYASVVRGRYRSAEQLPKPSDETWFATEQHLRLTNLPEDWSGKLMRVDLYRKPNHSGSSEGTGHRRVATADSKVNVDNQIWQNTMFSLAPRGQTPTQVLGSQRYQARIYVDLGDRMQQNPDAVFRESDLMATIEFGGNWKLGWREPMVVDAKGMTRIAK